VKFLGVGSPLGGLSPVSIQIYQGKR